LAALSSCAEGLGTGSVVMGVKDVMINSKVGNEIVFLPRIGILLKLRVSSSFGLAPSRIAGRNGGLLGSNLPCLTTSGIVSSAVCLGSTKIMVSVENVVVHSEIWNKVVFLPRISVLLELGISGCLCLASSRVAGWD
jgi:hypothetical protein